MSPLITFAGIMKNILVIGGSSGIGRSIVEIMNAKGAAVNASYRNHEPEPIQGVQYFHLDVSAECPPFDFLPEVLDGFVYCPGIISLKPFTRLQPEDFTNDFNVQVAGAVKILQKVLPNLKKSESASVVFFSTVAVQTGFTFHSVVSSSKGAIEGLTRALAAEWAPKIRVNCVAPSITDTPLAASLLNTPEKRETTAQRQPLRKIGKAEDVALAACFLLSDDARWITGQVLAADGGMATLKI